MLILDGTPSFRTAAGQLIDDVIPSAIAEGFKAAIFFNTGGSTQGTSMGCDINHVGKRNQWMHKD